MALAPAFCRRELLKPPLQPSATCTVAPDHCHRAGLRGCSCLLAEQSICLRWVCANSPRGSGDERSLPPQKDTRSEPGSKGRVTEGKQRDADSRNPRKVPPASERILVTKGVAGRRWLSAAGFLLPPASPSASSSDSLGTAGLFLSCPLLPALATSVRETVRAELPAGRRER